MRFPAEIPSVKNEFEHEFRNRYKKSALSIIPTSNENDFVICNERTSKAILVRTAERVAPEEQKSGPEPDPQLDAEVVESYRFRMDDIAYPPDIYVFTFNNSCTATRNFLIFTRDELSARLNAINENPDASGFYHLLIWVLPENYVFAANNMSTGEEWYLMGSGCKEHFERDLSAYLDRWEVF